MQSFVIPNKNIPKPNANTWVVSSEKALGVEDIRPVQLFLATKPMSDKNRVYILQAESLTIPAQNALLKTLEEPPGNSEIYLVTDQPEQLLPTVLSRVQIMSTRHMSNMTNVSYTTNLLDKLKTGNRLHILDEEKFTRESLLNFLNGVETIIHNDLKLAPLYKGVVETRKYLKANCNLKLCLAHLAAGL